MISKAITTSIRWWAKHPWMTFWGITLLAPLSIIIALRILTDLAPQPGTLLQNILPFVYAICSGVVVIAWILSFCRGMFVTRQRSKIRAALITVAALLIVVGILAAIVIPGSAAYRARTYDSDVKSNLKSAAKAEEAYYRVNGSYTANIDRLPGFNASSNVTIAVEATATTFVITGTRTKWCKADTGTWFISSTTGAIDGTPCSRP